MKRRFRPLAWALAVGLAAAACGASETPAAPKETEDAELARLVDQWGECMRGTPEEAPSARVRTELVVRAGRAWAMREIDAGRPLVIRDGPPDGPDVDEETGVLVGHIGCFDTRGDELACLAHNLAVRRAFRRGLIRSGPFSDRFFTETQAAARLRTAGVVIRRGDEGVAVPGTSARVRLGAFDDPLYDARDRKIGLLCSIERPNAEKSASGAEIRGDAALIAFREDGRVFLVATPAAADEWTRCLVFDVESGYHLQTLERIPPK